MTVKEKIITIEKIAALSLGNVGKYEFLTSEDILSEKRLLKKSCYNQNIWIFTIRKWIKKETDIGKDQYKLLKDQINVINNSRQNGVKVEDGATIKYIKIIDNMGYFYIVDEYKNLINKIKFGIVYGDLYLTNFDNQKIGLSKLVNKDLVQKNINADNSFILRNPQKIWQMLTIK